MNDNKLIKFLIPLVAAVVVFESIVLVNNLEKTTEVKEQGKTEEQSQVEEKVVEDPVIDFSFKVDSTNSTEMKVGKTYKVDLVLTPIKTEAIDGAETYITYDPKIFKVTGLSPNSKLVKPEVSKIDSELGVISNVILVTDKNGLTLTSGDEVNLLSFSVTPLAEGEYKFKLNSDDVGKNNNTLIVETSTAKSLMWTGGDLNVKVIK